MAARIRLVTFDVTNTILRVVGSAAHQYFTTASHFGVDIAPEKIQAVYRPLWIEHKAKYPHYGMSQGMSSQEWWSKFVTKVFLKCGYVGEKNRLESIIGTLGERYESGQNWELIPHVHATLDELREDGLKLAVISNFDETLCNILQLFKLDDYFDFVVTSVSARADKPDPEIFKQALEKAQLHPQQCVHVGDDLVNDYLGAQNVGMHALLLDSSDSTGKYMYGNDTDAPRQIVEKRLVIKSLSEIHGAILPLTAN